MQPPLTLSMAACSALSSTPEAAEDEAAAARQQRRGAEELAVVGATSTATIAMDPTKVLSPRAALLRPTVGDNTVQSQLRDTFRRDLLRRKLCAMLHAPRVPQSF